MPTQTRYFRSDSHTVNALTAKKLLTSRSGTQSSFPRQTTDVNQNHYFGIKMYKRSNTGVETQIPIDGSTEPQMAVMRNGIGEGLQISAGTPDYAGLEVTDSIVIKLWSKIGAGAWTEAGSTAVWTTEQLGGYCIGGKLWGIQYYTKLYIPLNKYWILFYDSELCDTKITSFQFGQGKIEKVTYNAGINGAGTISIDNGNKTWDFWYPKQLDNGTTKQICRKVVKVTVDYRTDPPTWGTPVEIDIETPSGFINPTIPLRTHFGYDFQTEELLIAVGEWISPDAQWAVTDVKLLAVHRTTHVVRVLHNDLLSLVKTVKPEATIIKNYAHFWGYDGKIVGTIAPFADTTEISVFLYYNGTWNAQWAYGLNNKAQEHLEVIFDKNDNFIGWLTEGHGMNSLFIRPDFTFLWCAPLAMGYTSEPQYDPVNHKVIWIQWGGAPTFKNWIYVSDPDPVVGCKNFTDVTPTGSITDNEDGIWDLNTMQKGNGSIFGAPTEFWFVLSGLKYGWDCRSFKVRLGYYNDMNYWYIIADSTPDDRYFLEGVNRCVDPVNKLMQVTPLIVCQPLSA